MLGQRIDKPPKQQLDKAMMNAIKKTLNLTRILGHRQAAFYLFQKLIAKVVDKTFTLIIGKDPYAKEIIYESCDDLLRQIDPVLASEAADFSARSVKQMSRERNIEPMGGAGSISACYFFTRALKPVAVIETGVARGCSSYAFLSALTKNKNRGTLYSSDLPYLKDVRSASYIGECVPDSLKSNWRLYLKGDNNNLREIIKNLPNGFQIMHYDSDKTFIGRWLALRILLPKLSPNGLVMMDDVGDNCFFKWFVERQNLNRILFKEQDKLVGLAWSELSLLSRFLND